MWGGGWATSGLSNLVYRWHYENPISKTSSQKLMLLTRVLADPFNQGYTKLKSLIVTHVIRKPVNSLHDIRAALQHPVILGGKAYTCFDFADGNGSVILAFEGHQQAHLRIAKTYNIPISSFYNSSGVTSGVSDNFEK